MQPLTLTDIIYLLQTANHLQRTQKPCSAKACLKMAQMQLNQLLKGE